MQKAIPKHRPAKNPASQKAKQSPTENRFKFQNNNPKTGRRALARRPVFGRRACAPRCCFEICIDFFVGLGLAFWPSLFQLDFGPLIFGLDSWIDCSKIFSKHFPNISKIDFPKKHFFQNRFFQNPFFPKSGFSKHTSCVFFYLCF